MALTEATRGITLSQITRAVIVTAAEVRAATGMKLPDALIVACAVLDRCDVIVGNDEAFSRIANVNPEQLTVAGQRGIRKLPRYVHLDDYIEAA